METQVGIRGVTFDAGGTLLECWPSVGHLYAEVAAPYASRSLSPALLNRRFAAEWRSLRHFRHTRAQWARLVDRTFRGLVETAPSRTFFEALYDRFALPGAWRVFPDVIPTLQAMTARGLKLGVISNWDRRLFGLLRDLGLSRFFAAVTVSCEAGACKPSRAIFRIAAARLGLPSAAILHVGDDVEKDLRAAQAAGFQARLLRRRGARDPGALRSLRGLARGGRLHISGLKSENYL